MLAFLVGLPPASLAIHILMDLCCVLPQVAAVAKVMKSADHGCQAINLGTGKGVLWCMSRCMRVGRWELPAAARESDQ